jgi:hypothetical protein
MLIWPTAKAKLPLNLQGFSLTCQPFGPKNFKKNGFDGKYLWAIGGNNRGIFRPEWDKSRFFGVILGRI